MWRGLLNSITQMIPTAAYGVAICYGGVLVAHHEIHYKHVIRYLCNSGKDYNQNQYGFLMLFLVFQNRISELLLYGVMTMSQTLVFAPTIATAFIGAYRLFKIIDRNPLIGSPRFTNKSQEIDKRDDISFQKIDFRYSTRPDVQILNGFDLRVSEGQTVALVGPSGRT